MNRQLRCSMALLALLSGLAGQDQPAAKYRWVDAKTLRVEGQAWTDTLAPFDRLPKRAKDLVRKPVWNLSRDSAGILLRFRSDATTIRARWSLLRKNLAMPHMPATGVSGLDLYVKHGGRWRWLGVGMPRRAPDNEATLARGMTRASREYLLYLPLYNGVSKLSLGVPNGASIRPGAPPRVTRPLVFYGTSITQGGCASRPGMVHTAILGRQLDCSVINLGFSGNGTMDQSMADLLAEIQATAFVIDCLPNMQGATVRQRLAPLVTTLRRAHPKTPIILVEDRSYANSFLLSARAQRNRSNRQALRQGIAALTEAGVPGLHLLGGDALLGEDGEATVDGSHPTDLGFRRQADAFADLLRRMLPAK